jgi:hypothetical protein
MDLKHVWIVILSYPRNWKVPFKDQTSKDVDIYVCGDPGETYQGTLGTDVKLKCTSFEWISS